MPAMLPIEVPVQIDLTWVLDGRTLDRAEVLSMYHAMGDWLIRTRPVCQNGHTDLDQCDVGDCDAATPEATP